MPHALFADGRRKSSRTSVMAVFLRPGHGCAVFTKQQRRKYRLEPIETSVFNRTFVRQFHTVFRRCWRLFTQRQSDGGDGGTGSVRRTLDVGWRRFRRTINPISETKNRKKQPPIECRYGPGKNVPDKKNMDGNVFYSAQKSDLTQSVAGSDAEEWSAWTIESISGTKKK